MMIPQVLARPHCPRLPRAIVLFAVIWACTTRAASAQVVIQRSREDVPAISRVLPAGVQRGTTATVTVSGVRMEGLSSLLGPNGVRLAKVVSLDDKQAVLELEVAADAEPGIFPFHLLCKSGLSNPRMLRIDDWPQLLEQEDNNTSARAMRVAPPVAVGGVLTATDQDYLEIEVAAGSQLVFDIEARRLGSPLRPVLTLFDAKDRPIRRQASPAGELRSDARFAHTFSESGVYRLRVSDLTYEGSEFSVYHLRIGPAFYAQSMFPLGGQRGTVVDLMLEGGNLGEPVLHKVDLTGAVPWRRQRLQIVSARGVFSAPALFSVGDAPETVEQEPNDDATQAAVLAAPVTVNGRIAPAGDRDRFRFHAAAGGRLVVRVQAEELGSPLDVVVSMSDANGNEIATADDRPIADREPPIVRSATPLATADDPVLEFAAPAEGDYVLTVEDLYGHGGPEHGYRLEVTQAPDEFELWAQPSVTVGLQPAAAPQQQQVQVLAEFSGASTGSLTLDRGGSGAIFVRALRGGYAGAIELTVEGLPAGVQCTPTSIPAGQNEAILNLTADFEAPSTASFVRILGRGQRTSAADGTTVPVIRSAVQPVVLSAMPVNGVVQHEAGMIALGVSQQGAELAVRGSLEGGVVPGTGSMLSITVKRREGFQGDVAVQITGLPAGLAAAPVTVPADQGAVGINITAEATLTPGRHAIILEGRLTVAGRNEPIVAVFPIEFDVLPLVALELGRQQVDLVQGGSTTVEVLVRRNGSAAPPIELTLSPLPKGVTAAGTTIPPDVDRFELVLNADEMAAASPVRRIVQIKARTQLGEQMLDLPSLRFALKVAKK